MLIGTAISNRNPTWTKFRAVGLLVRSTVTSSTSFSQHQRANSIATVYDAYNTCSMCYTLCVRTNIWSREDFVKLKSGCTSFCFYLTQPNHQLHQYMSYSLTVVLWLASLSANPSFSRWRATFISTHVASNGNYAWPSLVLNRVSKLLESFLEKL